MYQQTISTGSKAIAPPVLALFVVRLATERALECEATWIAKASPKFDNTVFSITL
jgi:hypothetical protein